MHESSSTKKVKISLVGTSGKMGQAIQELVEKDPLLEIANDGDVVIDFSRPAGTKKAMAMELPLVCGTTGLDTEILEEMLELSKRVPVLYSPNFSIGVAACFELLPTLKKHLGTSEISIHEIHHTHKIDSPSGTAKRMGELLGTGRITSERTDEIVGIHEVEFLLDNEKIVLRHEAFSRKAFAEGALRAAKFIWNKPPGLYSLKNIF